MDNEETKQTSKSVPPFTRLKQVDSDFAIAMALQEQERAFTMLTTIESESDEENEGDENDYEFFEGLEFEYELELLEGQDSNTDIDMEDDDDDDDDEPDELSYEELIALGGIISVKKRGLSLNEISTCLRPSKFQSVESKSGIDRCVVCQIEYEEGESLVSLPCLHPYHSECISKWLQVKKVCPICSSEAYC